MKQDILDYLESLKESKDTFVPASESGFEHPNKIRLLAYYLPQFHQIDLNKYYGRGFTEWTNVTKTRPAFAGHYQPKLPIDVGFYDLSHEDIMFRQIELAKLYGLYGFCSYYYWFSGEKLLEKPFENYLKNKSLDFPYCFCWDCSPWRKFWNDGKGEFVIDQKTNIDDIPKLCQDLLPHFQDGRYIRINNKPLFLMFSPQYLGDMPEVKAFMKALRDVMITNGLELYCVLVRTNRMYIDGTWATNPKDFGFDAFTDFPPHNLENITPDSLECPKKTYSGYKNYDFAQIWDIEKYIKEKRYELMKEPFKVFKSLFPSWDNTPRHFENGGGHIFYGESPELYKQWLSWCMAWTYKNHKDEERIVFINAWNEWAEGAYLEPDRKYGYAYLQKTKEALEMFYDDLKTSE